MSDNTKHVTIFADGACLGNPGPGGWGAVLLEDEKREELSGGYRLTTNNRMELMAAIVALEALPPASRVTLYSDSSYLVNGTTQVRRWSANGWRLQPRRAAAPANTDLWKRLLALCDRHDVTFHWVKGHASVAENERCDTLATEAAARSDLQIDQEFERTHPELEPLPATPDVKPDPARAKERMTQEGQPCRKCGTPVVRRTPRRQPKPGQQYYFEYYLACPQCRTMYLVDAAKRYLTAGRGGP